VTVTIAPAHLARARYVWRRVPWPQLAGVGMVCGPLLTVRALTAKASGDLLPFMRLTSLALAAATVLAVADAACSVTEPTRVGRLRLRVSAVSAAIVAAVVLWAVLLTIVRAAAATPQRLPVAGLLMELLAMSMAGWLIAAVLSRASGGRFMPARAAAMLVMSVAMTVTTPPKIRWFWVAPGPGWDRSHVRWAMVGAAALALFVVHSLDPARVPARLRVNRAPASVEQAGEAPR
jgi:hypothetical protein